MLITTPLSQKELLVKFRQRKHALTKKKDSEGVVVGGGGEMGRWGRTR